jgi:hypothetical protein
MSLRCDVRLVAESSCCAPDDKIADLQIVPTVTETFPCKAKFAALATRKINLDRVF